jgi:hypothetical protein
MADVKVKNYNTILARGDGTTPTEAFTAIARVKDLPAPSIVNNMEETSIYGNRWDENMPTTGKLEGFEIEVLANSENAQHEQLLDDCYSPPATPSNYKMTFPDTSFWVFAMWIESLSPVTSPRPGIYTYKIKFSPTNSPTITDPV